MEKYTVKKIQVSTSTEGLGDLPAELYAETYEEMLKDYFGDIEVEVEVSDRFNQTEIDAEFTLAPLKDPEDKNLLELKALDEIQEEAGRILQDAFDAACSRA